MLLKSKVLPDQANWPIEGTGVGVLMKAVAEKPYCCEGLVDVGR